jgi:hypothetical protein
MAARPTAVTICGLLMLEAGYYGFLGWTGARMFWDAVNVTPDQPLPGFVWSDALQAVILLLIAVLFAFDLGRVRAWFFIPAVGMFAYGIWTVAETFGLVSEWRGVFRGDFFPLELTSGVCFVAIGCLELLRILSKG